MAFQNFMISVELPAGLKLVDGSQLAGPVTYEVLSPLTPFYSSPDMVKLEGGVFLAKLSPITIASQIYWISRNVDALSLSGVPPLPPAGDETSTAFRKYRLFVNARQQYVTYKACHTLIQNVIDLTGKRGGKTLGNFSVEFRDMRTGDSGLSTKITQLEKEMEDLRPTITSGGAIPPRGAAPPMVAVWMGANYDESPPGRRWVTTGMGANATSLSGPLMDGTQQPPVKFCSSPYVYWYYNSTPILANTLLGMGL